MKLHKSIYSSIFLSVLTSAAFASHTEIMGSPGFASPGKFYVGVFGGGGAPREFDASQYGTAFFTEAEGGPLAVDAFGDTNHPSAWLFGAQIGYQVPGILNPNSQWTLTPAAELEGYYISNNSFTGHLVNDEATRLPEHDFIVNYPMKRAVFLANAVLNVNIPCLNIHPYVGAGIGGAVIRISGADATQISPPELGVNHYNSNTSDTDATFAGQIKLGLSLDITPCVSVFAEYRWLYLSSTQFSFGSTVYPGHAPTSGWQVKLDPQYYNLGAVGIRVNL